MLDKNTQQRISDDADAFSHNVAHVTGYKAGAEKEAELAQGKIDQYKKICEIAGVPKLLIDNPNLIRGQLPTDEQVRQSLETIKEWEKQTKNSK